MKLISLFLVVLMSGCTLESVTLEGRFADYIIRPRKPIVIDVK